MNDKKMMIYAYAMRHFFEIFARAIFARIVFHDDECFNRDDDTILCVEMIANNATNVDVNFDIYLHENKFEIRNVEFNCDYDSQRAFDLFETQFDLLRSSFHEMFDD